MKKFLMKNWRKVIIAFGIVGILISIFKVTFTPATIIQDFYDYGPENKKGIISVVTNVGDSGELQETANSIVDEASENASGYLGISEHLARPILVVAVLFCVILVLGNIMDNSNASAKKK